MEKSADAFRTISEVAEELDLPQHVLRFWETRFTQIKPLKRGGGRRFYRPDDIELLRVIRQLLYGEGYTIKGVQKILKEQGVRTTVAAYKAAMAQGAERLSLSFPEPPANPSNFESAPGTGLAPDDEFLPLAAPRVREDERRETRQASLPEGILPDYEDEESQAIGLPDADLHRLKALLGELAECERILQAARRS